MVNAFLQKKKKFIYEMTLEEVVAMGPPVVPDTQEQHSTISVRNPPLLIWNCNGLQKGKQMREMLSSASAVSRYVIRRGLSELATHKDLKELGQLVRKMREEDPESYNDMHYSHSLKPRPTQRTSKYSVFKKNGVILHDLSRDLDIHVSTLVILAYLIGILSSEELISEEYQSKAKRERDHFYENVGKHLERMRRLTG